MTDREKVIRGLECRSTNAIGRDCENCPYGIQMARRWGCDWVKLAYDALGLLKAQEAVVPKLGGNDGQFGTPWYQCGACSGHINPGDKYCRTCGRAVKWE